VGKENTNDGIMEEHNVYTKRDIRTYLPAKTIILKIKGNPKNIEIQIFRYLPHCNLCISSIGL